MYEYSGKQGEQQEKLPFTTMYSHFHIAHAGYHNWGLDVIHYTYILKRDDKIKY